jgi:hypothetical protein
MEVRQLPTDTLLDDLHPMPMEHFREAVALPQELPEADRRHCA